MDKSYEKKFCINCGAELSKNGKFCANCGHEIVNNTSYNNNQETAFLTGKKYLYGTTVNKDYKRAIVHLIESFELGKKEAIYHIAIVYIHLAIESLQTVQISDEEVTPVHSAIIGLHNIMDNLDTYIKTFSQNDLTDKKNNTQTNFTVDRPLETETIKNKQSENNNIDEASEKQKKTSNKGFFGILDDLLNDFNDDEDSFLNNPGSFFDKNKDNK